MTDQFLGAPTANWALVIAVLALLVAFGSLVVSWHAAYRDRSHLRVRMWDGTFQVGGAVLNDLVFFEATNTGRRPLTIQRFLLEQSDGTTGGMMPYPAYPLPRKVEEGEKYVHMFPMRAMQEYLQAKPADFRLTALVFESGDGRRFRYRMGRWAGWRRFLPWAPRNDWDSILRGPLVPETRHIELLGSGASVAVTVSRARP